MKNKITYFFSLILGCILMSFCINNQIKFNENNKEGKISPLRTFWCDRPEYKIESIKYNDTLDSNYGLIYGYVINERSDDTIQGLYSDTTNSYLHILDTNVNIKIDGLFKIKLPVGEYKICIESIPFYPIVNEIKIKSKESININYYMYEKRI